MILVARKRNHGEVAAMSGGKKGGKATPESVAWDEGLLKAIVEEVWHHMYNMDPKPWHPYIQSTPVLCEIMCKIHVSMYI